MSACVKPVLYGHMHMGSTIRDCVVGMLGHEGLLSIACSRLRDSRVH